MNICDFFDKITIPDLSGVFMDKEDCLVSQIKYGMDDLSDDELETYDIAIIGIEDETNSFYNKGCKNAINRIRLRLSSLRKISGNIKIIDLGNIRGRTLDDKYFVVQEVCKFLHDKSIVGVVVGGGQDFSFPVVQALNSKKSDFNIAIIDSCIDGFKNEDFSSKNFIDMLVCSCEGNIFDLCFLGLQNYFVGTSQEEKIEKENWGISRLKDLRGEKIRNAEPYLRDANIVSFDVSSVESSYVNLYNGSNVNGFTGYEACQLAWYSGMSKNADFFCFHEFNPDMDTKGKGELLSAEILWHFLEANSLGIIDKPSEGSANYKIFVVHLHNFNEEIRFYKNRYNERWWMEVVFQNERKIMSCSEEDYKKAKDGELPDKWWRHYKKRL